MNPCLLYPCGQCFVFFVPSISHVVILIDMGACVIVDNERVVFFFSNLGLDGLESTSRGLGYLVSVESLGFVSSMHLLVSDLADGMTTRLSLERLRILYKFCS